MDISKNLLRSKETILWAHQNMDVLKLSDPCKRSHLAGACLHAAIEHGMAIVVLIEDSLYGSAMGLMRLQLEAYLRGMWLSICATDIEVDEAGEDIIPRISAIILALDKSGGLGGGILTKIKKESLPALHSLTHTGYEQMRSHLNESGIGCSFSEEQIIGALNWAESWIVLSAVGMGVLTGNEILMHSALERAQIIAKT